METTPKVLIVEDEITNTILLKRVLAKEGYLIVTATNGFEAIKLMEKDKFDAVITDWMMPQMDGIELIRQIRQQHKPAPYIMMITALASESAKTYAMESGADDFVAKPIDIFELRTTVADGLAKHSIKDVKPAIGKTPIEPKAKKEAKTANSVALVVAASTGGPPTIIEFLKLFPADIKASIFIVQHGPAWMLETFTNRLKKELQLKAELAQEIMMPQLSTVYVAPGDKHIRITSQGELILDDGPKENFVKPAADPLFRSASEYYGKNCISVVLSGLGKDGAMGSNYVISNGGRSFIQDPLTAVAPSMPNSVLAAGVHAEVFPIKELAKEVVKAIETLNMRLKHQK